MAGKPLDTWVDVNLDSIEYNFKSMKQLVGADVDIIAVVKAYGYGHGVIEPSRRLLQAGAHSLAVSRLGEAVALRDAGITAPILVFTPLFDDEIAEAVERDISMTLTRPSSVSKTTEVAVSLNKTAHVQFKVDTGMGRLGLLPSELEGMLNLALTCPLMSIDGIYSHFATAMDASPHGCHKQLLKFTKMIKDLAFELPQSCQPHIANSSGCIRYPDARLHMVRVGSALFGQCSVPHCKHELHFQPTWQLKSRVCEVKQLPAGYCVGYGAETKTMRSTRTAVIPIGYADGYTVMPTGPFYRQNIVKLVGKWANHRNHVFYNGKSVPVLGRVAMQFTVLDVTDFPEIQLGSVIDVPSLRIPTSPLIPRVYHTNND